MQPFTDIRIANRLRLQLKHAGDDLQTILDAVIDLFEQELMTIESYLQFALVSLLFNRHSKKIGGALQEGYVVLTKFPFGSTIHLEYAERRAIAL